MFISDPKAPRLVSFQLFLVLYLKPYLDVSSVPPLLHHVVPLHFMFGGPMHPLPLERLTLPSQGLLWATSLVSLT